MDLTTAQMRLVRQLVDRFDRLENGSRMVVVHGEPGVGKTAVVHAFYEAIVGRAAERARPEALVWPDTLRPPDVARSAARKVVMPRIVDPLGVMPFAWWGRRCVADLEGAPVAVEAHRYWQTC